MATDQATLFDQLAPYSGWEDGFANAAKFIMDLGSPYCGTIDECAGTMNRWFEENILSDGTNSYVTLVFCAAEEDHKPDKNGNVWWYDHIQVIFLVIFVI